MTSRPSVVTSGSQISLPRAHPGGPAPGTTGVTVYRSDGGAVSNPPAAHSGGIGKSNFWFNTSPLEGDYSKIS